MSGRFVLSLTLFAAAMAAYSGPTKSQAEDWTRFRGPNGNGVSRDAVPVTWSSTENLKWKSELPGSGASCPIVVGDKVFVTCYSGYGMDRSEPGEMTDLVRHIVCLDRTSGKKVWHKEYSAVQPEDPYSGAGVPAHGYASNTPVTDGENIYVFFGKGGVLAFDLDGQEKWHVSVGTGSGQRKWGSAASPMVYKNVLVVPAMDESHAIFGLDKSTGKEIWKYESDTMEGTWSTPILVEVNAERSDIVVGLSGQIIGLNPRTGKQVWFLNGVPGRSFYSSVVAEAGVIYASVSGRTGGGSVAVKVGGEGDVSETHLLWKNNERSSFGSPVIFQDHMFLVSGGLVSAVDLKDGKRANKIRLGGGSAEEPSRNRPSGQQGRSGQGGQRARGGQEGQRARGGQEGQRARGGQQGQRARGGNRRGGGMGRFGAMDYGSPIIAGNKLYFVKGTGESFVLSADTELKQLGVNKLAAEGESFSATPAVSKGQIFLRSSKALYCVEANK